MYYIHVHLGLISLPDAGKMRIITFMTEEEAVERPAVERQG